MVNKVRIHLRSVPHDAVRVLPGCQIAFVKALKPEQT
jgi:hypothetical protein